MTAVHLVRAGAHVTLIERRSDVGPGLAHSTPHGSHLLNVPAARMSALPDQPAHFQEWATANTGRPVAPTDFLPRALYGAYLRAILAETVSAAGAGAFRSIAGDATGIDVNAESVRVALADGAVATGDALVLALGNAPPGDPPIAGGETLYASAHYIRDPWTPGALELPDRSAPVVLLGTGLTMLDIALALADTGHTGTITAISRRGQLPRWHTDPPGPPAPSPSFAPGASPRQALRAVRRAIGASNEWRPHIDVLRPITPAIWRAWSDHQRASFLRHIRPWWDAHRHRAAPAIGARIDAMLRAGTLRIVAGHPVGCAPHPTGCTVTVRPRGTSSTVSISGARVINCTGPGHNIARTRDPLVRSLIDRGFLTPDPLGLGATCGLDGRILDRSGHPIPRVWAVGLWRIPQVWESVAVPELKTQAAETASAIMATARTGPGITPDRVGLIQREEQGWTHAP